MRWRREQALAPLSIAAMVTVSDLVSLPLLVVKRLAIVRAEGMRINDSAPALSACLRQIVPSLTPRREPRNPCVLKHRYNSVPFRLPARAAEGGRRGRQRDDCGLLGPLFAVWAGFGLTLLGHLVLALTLPKAPQFASARLRSSS